MSKSPCGLRRDEKVGEGLNRGRWVVVRKIGEGGFAEVYEVQDTLLSVKQALKIEKIDKRGSKAGLLKSEHRTLKRLQDRPHVCQLVEGSYGTHEGKAYFVMELLGTNLAQLQRSVPGNRWDLRTTCKMGLAILDCLQGIHEAGFVHRDVKPANFVLHPREQLRETGEWKVIDFGISRSFLAEDGSTVPARNGYQAFRGSTTYASSNAHSLQDLGRRDDLWSWLYMMVEMLDGALPWRPERGGEARDADAADKETAKEMAQELKAECLQDPRLLVTEVDCPDVFPTISRHLASLAFDSTPDYALLRQSLVDAIRSAGLKPWEASAAKSQTGQQIPSPQTGDGRSGKRARESEGTPSSPAEKRARMVWSTPQHSPYVANGASPGQTLPHQQYIQSPPMQSPPPPPPLASDLPEGLADLPQLVRPGWLSAEALHVADAVGRLDPAEGIGIVAWIVKEVGGAQVDSGGRQVLGRWLQQLSTFAAQTAAQLNRNHT